MSYFNKIKEKLKQYKDSEHILERVTYQFLLTFRIAYLLLKNGRIRVELFAKWKNNPNHHQISTFTKSNRYPDIFKECSQYLQPIESPRILSFGCSTGEEVRTLSQYLPTATVYGVDINQWCIKQCIKQNTSNSQHFYHRLSKEFNSLESCDAIFCMAVFQKTDDRLPNKKDNTKLFTFSAFEEDILILDQKLKIKGLLIIDHSDFNFLDTVIAKNYEPLNFEGNQILRKFPLFDTTNQKISDEKYLYRVFAKLSAYKH